jgi:mRNA-degrading endonuclease RelE of RelBE toxin-antitoxin system
LVIVSGVGRNYDARRVEGRMGYFQISFSDLSAKELAAMPKLKQLELLSEFQVSPEDLAEGSQKFGQITRKGRTLYRYRTGDYRIYFEKVSDGILVRCILNKNTLKDFVFRSQLPVAEDELLADNPKFWDLINRGGLGRR